METLEKSSGSSTTENKKETSNAMTDLFVCATPNCSKASTMQCPTCLSLGLVPSYFCSQECFKEFWPVHKLFHKKKDEEKDNFKYTGSLRPGKVTPMRFVPENIAKPDYWISGYPTEEKKNKSNKIIVVNTPEEIEIMRQVCLIGRKALDHGHSLVKPGITTDEIDRAVHDFIIKQGAYPSPLNYNGFPKSLCTSVNEVICHGIPDDRPLKEGDIINLDVSVYYKGMHSDLNETYAVGKVDEESLFLIEKCYRSLEKAISICKSGVMYKEIGNTIEKYIKENGLSVVRSYTGHGVGKDFHSAPNIPHFAGNKTAGFMKPGHIFTIEPMINQGVWRDELWADSWTSVTADGKRSAQFEHTLLITDDGVEVLTKRLEDSPPLDFKI